MPIITDPDLPVPVRRPNRRLISDAEQQCHSCINHPHHSQTVLSFLAHASSQEARDYCQRVIKVLKKLQANRRMGLSEIQLTIEIEQPEEIERNKVLGIEVRTRQAVEVSTTRDRMRALLRSTEHTAMVLRQ